MALSGRAARSASAQFLKVMTTDVIELDHVISLFIYLRKMLEAERAELRGRFKVLETYCDWFAHTSINNRKHFHVLIRLTAALNENLDCNNTQSVVDALGKEFFSYQTLFEEIDKALTITRLQTH